MAGGKGVGRPADNSKGRPIHVRLDTGVGVILEAYCVRENMARVEVIRRGIPLLNRQD